MRSSSFGVAPFGGTRGSSAQVRRSAGGLGIAAGLLSPQLVKNADSRLATASGIKRVLRIGDLLFVLRAADDVARRCRDLGLCGGGLDLLRGQFDLGALLRASVPLAGAVG